MERDELVLVRVVYLLNLVRPVGDLFEIIDAPEAYGFATVARFNMDEQRRVLILGVEVSVSANVGDSC